MGVNSQGLAPFYGGLGEGGCPANPGPARRPHMSPLVPKCRSIEFPCLARGPHDPQCPQEKAHTLGRWRELEAIRENYEERAAILEFDAGMSRREAEEVARALTGYEGA